MAVFPIKGTLGIIAFKRGIGEISISTPIRERVAGLSQEEGDSQRFVRKGGEGGEKEEMYPDLEK